MTAEDESELFEMLRPRADYLFRNATERAANEEERAGNLRKLAFYVAGLEVILQGNSRNQDDHIWRLLTALKIDRLIPYYNLGNYKNAKRILRNIGKKGPKKAA